MQSYDIELVRGDDTALRVYLSGADGALDLRGCTFDLHAARKSGDEPLLRLSSAEGSITAGSDSGSLTLYFAHAATADAQWKSAVYDLQMTDSAGMRRTVLRGSLNLIHDITRV